jgi:hypothetical protein
VLALLGLEPFVSGPAVTVRTGADDAPCADLVYHLLEPFESLEHIVLRPRLLDIVEGFLDLVEFATHLPVLVVKLAAEVVEVLGHRHTLPAGEESTTLTWIVTLRGPMAAVVRPVFARIYGRNVDRAIPRLQAWILNP